jgi:hypothetical protein
MQTTDLTDEQFVELGESIYRQQIRQFVEPAHDGSFLAIEVSSGDYELAENLQDALDRAHSRWPNSVFYLKRVGHSAAIRIGKSLGAE